MAIDGKGGLSRQPFHLPLVPLPVPAPVMARPSPGTFLHDVPEDFAVSPAPILCVLLSR